MPEKRRLRRSFFVRDTLTCARELIGCELIWDECAGIIVETEAYLTTGDEACHTFTRPSTRSFVARNQPGAAYIYLNYGMHWMLNVLAGDGLILFRAVQPTRGLELMKKRRGVTDERRLCSGPGKLTQAFGITSSVHEMDLCADPRRGFGARAQPTIEVTADARIGITRSADFPWRFTLRGSRFVSVCVRAVDGASERPKVPRSS